MTDKQREIFQKIMEGKVMPWMANEKTSIFQEETPSGNYYLITHYNEKWDDYDKAWKAYERLPLVKALK